MTAVLPLKRPPCEPKGPPQVVWTGGFEYIVHARVGDHVEVTYFSLDQYKEARQFARRVHKRGAKVRASQEVVNMKPKLDLPAVKPHLEQAGISFTARKPRGNVGYVAPSFAIKVGGGDTRLIYLGSVRSVQDCWAEACTIWADAWGTEVPQSIVDSPPERAKVIEWLATYNERMGQEYTLSPHTYWD